MDLANRAKKLTKVGVDTPAHIDSMTPTGNTDTPGGTEYDITMTISPAGGEAYHVTMNQCIYPSNPFNAGENVTVKVDPDDADVAMIFGKACSHGLPGQAERHRPAGGQTWGDGRRA